MTSAVLAIDQGTTGSTALVLSRDGRILGRSYAELPQHYPRPGWVEHDPEDIWRGSRQVMEEALQAARLTPGDLRAIGITNQRETTVVWDRITGQPLHHAIVWQSRQTAEICRRMKQDGLEPHIRQKTGLVLDPYFSGTKIRWILDQYPDAAEKAAAGDVLFGTVDTWLLWRLTGGRVHATEPTNASRTLLFDLEIQAFSPELCDLFGVPEAMLPKVRPSAGIFGETVATGDLPAGIPVAGMAGDQQAALFGQGCWRPGEAKNTYGTGCFLLLNTGERRVASEHGLLTTVVCDAHGRAAYGLEGSVFVAGAALQWLRDELQILGTAGESEALAESIEDTGGVYLVPAFAGLGAPYWDSDARGALVGLTRGSGRAHLARAALESIAYQTRDVVDAMNADSGVPLAALRVDGGAAANDFLMQFQADLLNVPVDRPRMLESTAAGSAYLAGLATGVWESPEELAAIHRLDRRFTPSMDAATRSTLYRGWQEAVARVRTS